MPKSTYTGATIYADVATRAWVHQQDWESKFSRLTKPKRDALEALAIELNGGTAAPAKKVKPPAAKVVEKKKVVPEKKQVVLEMKEVKKRKTVTNNSDSQGEEFKKRKITGYSIYAKKIRKEMKERGIPPDQIDVKEMQKRYRALDPDRKKRYEARADAQMNE